MKDDFQAIKSHVDITDEIKRRTGKSVKKEGRTYNLEQCPFCGGHDCFKIWPDKRSWSCYQCAGNPGGTIIDFVMKKKNCSRYDALVDLAQATGYTLQNTDASQNNNDNINNPITSIFEAAANHYAKTLYNNLEYQTNIRKHSDTTLKAFKVGFTDGNLFTILQKQDFPITDMLKSGLIVSDKEKGYRDFFIKNLYIYPHRDKAGNICHFTVKDPKGKYNYQQRKKDWLDGAPFLNMQAFKSSEIVIVEGENDLLSVYGKGDFTNVVAIIGQISKEQIQYLKKWATTGPNKTIYLCFDNDSAGENYRTAIKQELQAYCLSDKQYTINKKLRVRQQNQSKDDDSGFNDNVIPELTQVILKTIKFDKRIKDIDDLLKGAPNPKQEFKKLIDQAERHLKPLGQIIAGVKHWYKSSGLSNCTNEIGEVVFDYFNTVGGFFISGEDCKLFYQNQIYEIDNNIAFKSLLYNTSGLNYAGNNTKNILEVVKAKAYVNGKHTKSIGWIYTDYDKLAVYIDLHNESNNIVKIQPGNVELLQNGANEDQILLQATPRMEPLDYLPNADIQFGMDKFKELILDNLTCKESNKFYIATRIFSTILLEFIKARGITKFSGNQGTAKSCGARLISYLIIGSDCVSQGSVSSYRSEATKSPFIFPDNLEKMNRTQEMISFFLISATGGINQKRDINTKSGNIYEDNKAHIITTSIEPFTEPELISRTIDITFKKEFQNKHFPGETSLMTQIEQYRDLIMSCIFKIIAFDVLPTFTEDKTRIFKLLDDDYPDGHSKARLNEMLSCLYLLCRQIVKYIPHSKYTGRDDPAAMILDDWINEQEILAIENQQESDPVLYRLEILFDECSQLKKEGFADLYGIKTVEITETIEGQVEKIRLIASSRELSTAFSILSKKMNIANPFASPAVLGKRLLNSKKVLEEAGWEVEMHHTKYNGQRKHLLEKRVEE